MSSSLTDVQALAHLATRLRDELGLRKWDRQGVDAIFTAELIGLPLADVVRRVVGHATDPDARTPAAIRRPFVPKATDDDPHGPRFPPKVGTGECRHHTGEHAGSCRLCPVSDITHPQDPVIDDPDRTAGRDLVASIRAQRTHPDTQENR
jgi:hypothetical protein